MNRNPWVKRGSWNVLDARSLSDKVIECDVAIIGTGPGGAVSAARLSKAGYDVCLVEDGGLNTAKDFAKNELESFSLYQDNGFRLTKNLDIQILQGRTVGGSSTINWTSSFRLPETTLDFWKNNYDVSWNMEDINPWFSSIEEDLNIHQWPGAPNTNNQILAKGLEKLGHKSQRLKRNVSGCHNLGYCGMGCPVNAKNSMLITKIPDALELGAKLIHNAYAYKYKWSGSKISSLSIRPSYGPGKFGDREISLKAKHFILAAGGIGSPGVLLRSEAPNPHNTLGQRTTLHPVVASAARMKEEVHGYVGAPQTVYSDAFMQDDEKNGTIAFKLETTPIFPTQISSLIPMHGPKNRKYMEKFPHVSTIIALMRDGYHEESLGGTIHLDSFQRPILDYPWSETLERTAKKAMKTITEVQFAAGAEEVYPIHVHSTPKASLKKVISEIDSYKMSPPFLKVLSAHVMGGCSMGAPERGVVNEWGQHHQLENLHVFDGSMFPTSLGVNPQGSIYGIVSFLSERLIKSGMI